MNTWLNKLRDNEFATTVAVIVLAILLVGGYAAVKMYSNHEKAAACEAAGGTAYGQNNWLCAK